MSSKSKKASEAKDPADGGDKGGTWESSQPEIRVAYAPAGRETLDAITAEVGAELEVELAPHRAPQHTLPYADRLSNAPGSQKPSARRGAEFAPEPAPEISVSETPAGRETLAAIEFELRDHSEAESAPASATKPSAQAARASVQRDAPADQKPAAQASEAFEIFEMVTFVVRGPEAARLATDSLRRRFVEENLMHRLPVASTDAIDRVDVTPWTVRGTFVVRVWCRVDAE